MVQKAKLTPTATDKLREALRKNRELYSVNRTLRTPISLSTAQIGNLGGSAGGVQAATSNFLKTQGDTMVGPIAFFPTTQSIVSEELDIAPPLTGGINRASTYVIASFASPATLSLISGASFSGQLLYLEVPANSTLTIEDFSSNVGGNILTADGNDLVITTPAANPQVVTFLFDVTQGPNGNQGGWLVVGTSLGGGGGTTGNEFADNLFRIFDNIDNTRKLAFEVGGIAASTTQTLTVQNASGTLPLLDGGAGTQIFSNAIAMNSATLDMDGNDFILDADGDTFLSGSIDDRWRFHCNGVQTHVLREDRITIQSTGPAQFNSFTFFTEVGTPGFGIGQFVASGHNTVATDISYARWVGIVGNPTAGNESGRARFDVAEGGGGLTGYMEYRGDILETRSFRDLNMQGNDIENTGNILPNADATFDVGSDLLSYNTAFVGRITFSDIRANPNTFSPYLIQRGANGIQLNTDGATDLYQFFFDGTAKFAVSQSSFTHDNAILNNIFTFNDNAGDPLSNGQLARNGTDLKIFSGGSVRNISDMVELGANNIFTGTNQFNSTTTFLGIVSLSGITTSINSGTILIGDTTADNVSVLARFTTNLVPDGTTQDLGQNGNEWDEVHGDEFIAGDRYRSDSNSSECGFFVRAETGSIGTRGSLQVPVSTAFVGTAANADTLFGAFQGALGLQDTGSGNLFLFIRQQDGNWAAAVFARDTIV